MKTLEIALFLYSLSIISTCLPAHAENNGNTHTARVTETGSDRAARSFSKGGQGFEGFIKRVMNDEGMPALALITQSGTKYFLELGSDSELKSRLDALVTEDGQRDASKVFVVSLAGTPARKGEGKALRQVSIESPESDDEIRSSHRAYTGKYQVNLKDPGLITDHFTAFLKRLSEAVPGVSIVAPTENGQPYSGLRYVSVLVSSDFSRSYLDKLIAENNDLKALVSSVEVASPRGMNFNAILARP